MQDGKQNAASTNGCTLPDAAIASHVDMKFICHTINLFRSQPTVAEHANLDQSGIRVISI